MQWNCKVPDTIKVKVSKGWVIFEGTVEAQYQKDAAEMVLRCLKGAKGFANEIEVKPSVDITVLERRIRGALERCDHGYAENIIIGIDREGVTLTGHVHSRAKREGATRTALATPGVTKVNDLIEVS